jgi:hypothetical protein
MTDKQFQALIDRTSNAQNRFRRLLKQAEAEYERRYGFQPSDADDDQWIDGVAGGCGEAGGMTVEQVAESARSCAESNSDSPNPPT